MHAVQSGQRLVGIGGLVVEHHLVAGHEVSTGDTVVIHRSNGQGVGVGAGRAGGIHADVIRVQIADILRILNPAAGVAGRHDNDRSAVLQIFQNALICLRAVPGHAGIAGAQGQVHGIGIQNDGVFNGDHVIGVIGAAALAEDLHDHQLSVRSNALHMNSFQCMDIGVAAGHIGVGGGNTSHMGAMLTLRVIDMYNIQVLIHIVVGKGNLAVAVEAGSGRRNMELIGDYSNLVCIQQIQTGLVLVHGLAGLAGQISQRVLKAAGGEALVVDIQAGIDNGNTAAGAGITVGPGSGRADLFAGGGHVGIRSFLCVHHSRLIAGLDHDVHNTGYAFNGLDLAVFHVGGNDVGNQSQLLHHIQRLADCLGNGCNAHILHRFQGGTVGHRTGVGGDILRRASFFDGGFAAQHDGNTDGFRIGIGRRFRCFCNFLSLDRLDRNSIVVHFLKCDVGCVVGSSGSGCGKHKAHAQRNGKHQRKQTLGQMLVHTSFSFQFYKRKQRALSDLTKQSLCVRRVETGRPVSVVQFTA